MVRHFILNVSLSVAFAKDNSYVKMLYFGGRCPDALTQMRKASSLNSEFRPDGSDSYFNERQYF